MEIFLSVLHLYFNHLLFLFAFGLAAYYASPKYTVFFLKSTFLVLEKNTKWILFFYILYLLISKLNI